MSTIVTDGQIAKLSIKYWELFRRVKEGSIRIEPVLNALQQLIEGKTFGAGAIINPVECVNFSFMVNHLSLSGSRKVIIQNNVRSRLLKSVDLSTVCLKNGFEIRNEFKPTDETLLSHYLTGDPTGLEIAERLQVGEKYIPKYIPLDATFFTTLWDNKDLIPELWKHQQVHASVRIFFDGTVFEITEKQARWGQLSERVNVFLHWGEGGVWTWGNTPITSQRSKNDYSVLVKADRFT